ncbi:MAG: hypothetical protein QG654_84 [Patescibacteria group bacterium]|nr:hypothetical protein [Patescibacteria group bacterium]
MDLKTFIKIALIFSVVFLPFWVTSLLFIFSVFYFDNFYFGLFIMFILDLMYGFETVFLFNIPGVVFFGSTIVFVISLIVKNFINIRK